MIYDHISNRANYKGLQIEEALEYLARLRHDNLPKEKTYLNGDSLIANPLAYETKPAEACVFEGHRTYADVHFILDGEESVSIASHEGIKVTKAYSEENDTVYFDGTAVSKNIMRPGDFMVCYPQDIHRTGEAAGSPCGIRKIVVKVKVS